MRQILVRRNSRLSINPRDPSSLLLGAPDYQDLGPGVNSFRVDGVLSVLSGSPRFKFKVTEELAREGVFLLGAYEDAGSVSAYLSVLAGIGTVSLTPGRPVLEVTSDDQDTLTLIEGDARFSGGVIRLDPTPTPTGGSPMRKSPAKKRARKR